MAPIIGFAFLAFLVFLVMLAFAALLAFRGLSKAASGGPGVPSTVRGSVVQALCGLAMAFSLIVLAGVGTLGCTAATIAMTVNHAIEHGPIRLIELGRASYEGSARESLGLAPLGGATAVFDDEHLLRLSVVVEGSRDFADLRRWLREETDGDVHLSVTPYEEDGHPYSLLEFGLPADGYDLDEFEREFRREIPWMDLPDAIRVDLRELRKGR